MSNVKFPDPTVDHAQFLYNLSSLPPDTKLSLRHARAAGTEIKKGRVWTIEFGEHLNRGLNEGTLGVVMLTLPEGARINHFFMNEDALSFWQTGKESGQSAEDIFKGWEALQSIASDLEVKPE